MDPNITYPRIFIKNSEGISCQLIRNPREMKEFKKIGLFRRCMIEDYENFQYWKKAQAPYNDENMTFGIQKNHFEAFTGETMKEFPPLPKELSGLITRQRWKGMNNGEV